MTRRYPPNLKRPKTGQVDWRKMAPKPVPDHEKLPCRCPTDWCRLEPDNGAQYCPDLEPHEFCGMRNSHE